MAGKFLSKMHTQQTPPTEELMDNFADIEYSKPSKARFLFQLFFFGFFIFMIAVFYGLYTHKYESNAGIKVQPSSQYQPQYN